MDWHRRGGSGTRGWNRHCGKDEDQWRHYGRPAGIGCIAFAGDCAVLQRIVRSKLELVVVEFVGNVEYGHRPVTTRAPGFAESPAASLAGPAYFAAVATRFVNLEAHCRFHKCYDRGVWAVLQVW